jgi:hypothetical protein
MGTLSFIDSAFPLTDPPASDGVCFYLGGDALNVWSRADIDAQPARYRLPIFVRSDPPGPGAAADVAAALSQLAAVGAPKGILICWDMETAADPSYIRGVWTLLREVGYPLIVYGTQTDVFGNDNPSGLYFGAQWTGTAHIAAGDQMTQFVAFQNLDEDLAESTLPFWDTRPAPKPPPQPSVPLAVLLGDDMSGYLLPKSLGPTPITIPSGVTGIRFSTVDGTTGGFKAASIQVNWHGSTKAVDVSVNPDGTWPVVEIPPGQGGASVWRTDEGGQYVGYAFITEPAPATTGS